MQDDVKGKKAKVNEARTVSRTRDEWCELADDYELLFADGFDEAIVGVASRISEPPVVVYDIGKVLDVLVAQGLTPEEAEEHFHYNVAGSWVGDRTPMFMATGYSAALPPQNVIPLDTKLVTA